MSQPKPRTTFVTERQATVHALYLRHRSMSVVARMMGVSQITVRETLVQHQRNKMRDAGKKPPPLKVMLRGGVAARFGVSLDKVGGRPVKHDHEQIVLQHDRCGRDPEQYPDPGVSCRTNMGRRRWIITCAEPNARLHVGFWTNLLAYAEDQRAIGTPFVG